MSSIKSATFSLPSSVPRIKTKMLFVHAQIARHELKKKYRDKMEIDEMEVLALVLLHQKCIIYCTTKSSLRKTLKFVTLHLSFKP